MSMSKLEFLKPYLGRIVATVAFLVVGILFLTIGFWSTLLLIILVLAGYAFGCIRDGVMPFRKTMDEVRMLR